MNELYELYKKARSLSTEEKFYLLDNFLEIVNILEDQEREANFYDTFQKYASGSHDPETVPDLQNLIESILRFIKNDGDLSYSAMSVFLHPLCSGAKRVCFRPFKLVGLTKHLANLSKEFEKNQKNLRNIGKIRRNFNSTLIEIKRRLAK
jgi:hypothetical protein